MCLERRLKLAYSSTIFDIHGKIAPYSAEALQNERWKYVRVDTVAETRFNLDNDRRWRVDLYSCLSSYKYSGVNPWIHLYVKIKILYILRYLTGSQCNFWSTWVIWSWKRVRVTSLETEFCILWSFVMCGSEAIQKPVALINTTCDKSMNEGFGGFFI